MTEASNSQEIIICRDVHKWFDQFHVLKGISLTVQKGEVIVIFGPSGSGKSTFIRCLNRLEEHQKGQIIVDGIELGNDIRNVEKIRQEVGMVFQQFNLFPHLTVLQNITLAPSWVKRVPWPGPRGPAAPTSDPTWRSGDTARPSRRRSPAPGTSRTAPAALPGFLLRNFGARDDELYTRDAVRDAMNSPKAQRS